MPYGETKTATCSECGTEFEYVFTYKNRVVCDNSDCRYQRKLKQNRECKQRIRGVPLTRVGQQCPHHRDTKGLGPRPKLSRDECFKPLDIQRMTPDQIVRAFERGVV